LVLIGLWLYHDRHRTAVRGGPLTAKEILLVFFATVAVVIVGLVRISVFV
jgi:hypothetical protein